VVLRPPLDQALEPWLASGSRQAGARHSPELVCYRAATGINEWTDVVLLAAATIDVFSRRGAVHQA